MRPTRRAPEAVIGPVGPAPTTMWSQRSTEGSSASIGGRSIHMSSNVPCPRGIARTSYPARRPSCRTPPISCLQPDDGAGGLGDARAPAASSHWLAAAALTHWFATMIPTATSMTCCARIWSGAWAASSRVLNARSAFVAAPGAHAPLAAATWSCRPPKALRVRAHRLTPAITCPRQGSKVLKGVQLGDVRGSG